jgi:predicted N-acyltransferase
VQISIHQGIGEIPAWQWNQLVKDRNPFVNHGFLLAMEQHHCVGEQLGWSPLHIGVYEEGSLVAAMPLYKKTNSYGEFVFDHAWSDAWQRVGLSYYPKLVSAIPYTPATGQRLLCESGREKEFYPLLLKATLQLTESQNFSGLHILFPEAAEQAFLQHQDLISRHDCQYHWHNRKYDDFDDFLSRLTARKRKNIRRERQKALQSGVQLRCLDGHSASDQDWHDFTRFYNKTFAEKWGMATFNFGFFSQVARAIPDQVLLVLADHGSECIAGALMYRSDHTLYGRHWGSSTHIDSLHFEACYYQGIEYCIANRLQHFEPGAQGEHKIARGFEPSLTRSFHWLQEEQFRTPVTRYCEQEKAAVADYMAELGSVSAYRSEEQ